MLLDGSGRIDEDLACRFCGYPLRGLDPAGVCPECAALVAAAGRPEGGGFEQCDPRWVRRLASGARWLALVHVVALAAVGAAVALEIVLGIAALPAAGARVAMLLIFSLVSIATACAAWIFTTPDPGAAEDGWSLRRLTRWCMMAEIVHGPVLAYLNHGGVAAGGAVAGVVDTVLLAIFVATTLVSTIGVALLLAYARRLALRIPRPRLATGFKAAAIGYVSAVAGMSFFAIAFEVWPALQAGATVPAMLLLFAFLIVLLLYLQFLCFVIVLLARLGRRLSETAILGGRGGSPCAPS